MGMVALRVCGSRGPTTDFAGFVDALAPLLSASELSQESLRRVWRIMDEERRGSISAYDLARLVRNYGLQLTMEEIADMVEFAAHEQSGQVSFDEFSAVLARARRM